MAQEAGFSSIPTQDLVAAYARAKSSVILDSCRISRENFYKKMNFGEFVEAVCRLVMIWFANSEMAKICFFDKLRFGLENFLEIVGETVQVPVEEIESPFKNKNSSDGSQSDD